MGLVSYLYPRGNGREIANMAALYWFDRAVDNKDAKKAEYWRRMNELC